MAMVTVDEAAIKAWLVEPDGPVARHMMVAGEAVKQATLGKLTSYPRVFLGPQLVKRLQMFPDGPHVFVGAANTKTKPHVIRGNPTLAFKWKRVGPGMFFFASVNHPGSDFTKYLTERLITSLVAAGTI